MALEASAAAIAAKRESCVPDKKQRRTRNFSRKMSTKNGAKNQQLENCPRISGNTEDSSLPFLWIYFQASALKINQNFQLAKQEVCHPNIGLCSW